MKEARGARVLRGAGRRRVHRGDDASTTIRVGAVYPLSGSQGPGGIDEHRGVMLAADLVNQDGGIDGRPIRVESVDTPGADAAAAAVDQLHDAGIDLVLGSYGSTISAPASAEAASNGMLFWETGAVGMLPAGADRGGLTFRVPPTGAVLGTAAIAFIARSGGARATPRSGDASATRCRSWTTSTAGRWPQGAEHELRARGLPDVGSFGYDFRTVDMAKLVRRIAAAKPDVLFVSAYLEDAIAMRRELVAQHVKLFANIGTSSSYCMPAFGATLGRGCGRRLRVGQAVGVHDQPRRPAPGRARRCCSARATPTTRAWDEDMSPAALAGFSAAWAFFTDVLPAAASLDAGRRRRGRPSDRPAAGQLAERERAAVRRARHARRRRQRRRRQRDLGMGGARRGRRHLAAGVRDPAHGSERVGRVVSRRAAIVVGLAVRDGLRRARRAVGAPLAARPRPAPGRHRPAAGLPMGEPAPGPRGEQPAAVVRRVPRRAGRRRLAGADAGDLGQPGDGDRAAGRVRRRSPGRSRSR